MEKQRFRHKNRLVWVDTDIEDNDADTHSIVEHLKMIVHHFDHFTQIHDCIQFLKQITDEKVLIITSESFGQPLVKQIHHLSQVDAIYILSDDLNRHQSWISQWSKIKGVHDHIRSLCQSIRTSIKRTNEDLTPISFASQSEVGEDGSIVDLNRLEASFMYTILFKRILLDIEHGSDGRKSIVELLRVYYADNQTKLKVVEEFNRDYRPNTAIWWYTRELFTYEMVNRALRLLEADLIVDMGFFIHDLHRQLEQLHEEQFSDYHGPPLTVYRGQTLSIEHFIKLKRNKGGLLAFNSFLSTTTANSVSLAFAQSSISDDTVGIVFVMIIDPTIGSATFANIKNHSYFPTEDEVLFSMHTVFRIDDILESDSGQKLFHVQLTLTSEGDPELTRLTDRMEREIGGGNGWFRLGNALFNVGQLNKVEELFQVLLSQKPNKNEHGIYYHQLGLIKNGQGDYREAIKYCELAISIEERLLSATDPLLATFYNNAGSVYDSMGEYSQAMSYYNKALAIRQKSLPADHSDVATSYNNIGLVHYNVGQHSQAMSYYKKAINIREKSSPINHPHLAILYNNIGLVYDSMGEYSQALFYYKKALAIREKTLPTIHPLLATLYNNMGSVYNSMGECSQTLSYYNKAIDIREKTLPPNHPHSAISYHNIGMVYDSMGEHSRALIYYNKAMLIREKTLGNNHSDLAFSKNNIKLGQAPCESRE